MRRDPRADPPSLPPGDPCHGKSVGLVAGGSERFTRPVFDGFLLFGRKFMVGIDSGRIGVGFVKLDFVDAVPGVAPVVIEKSRDETETVGNLLQVIGFHKAPPDEWSGARREEQLPCGNGP